MDSAIGELTGPVAARLRQPSWRDPRLLVGLVLVAGSVALGSWAVSTAQATTGVYAARTALAPGEEIGPDQLTVVQVRFRAEDAARYLSAGKEPPPRVVVLRGVAQGELVPRGAVGDPATLDLRSVPVSLDTEPSAGVVKGALVDLWTVPRTARAGGSSGTAPAEQTGAPVLLAGRLTVAEVSRPTGSLSISGRTVVHVLVPSADLPKVLSAMAGDGTMQVMHVPGTGG
jgi:hypothetical protein